MKFNSVRVGPFNVQLALLTGQDASQYLGLFDGDKLVISLREHYPTEQQRCETLLHEILHAVYQIYNCKPRMDEEQVVHMMSLGIAGVMRDNAELWAWMMKGMSCE